jgi:FlaA1/EpsC-like NDP-sugar epimerase
MALAFTGARPSHPATVLVLFIVIKLAATVALGNLNELWSHTSLEDLVALIGGSILTTLMLALGLAVVPQVAPPLLALADGAFTVVLLAPLRIAPRIYYELVRPRLMRSRSHSVVLAGRPELVDLELRRIRRRASAKERVAGLVLDGPTFDGALMHRLRILGRVELGRLIERKQVHEVTLVPPATPRFSGWLQELCTKQRIPCRSAASMLALNELCTHAEQLIDRWPQNREDPHVREAIAGRCIMVTGAGGSIGRELALQLLPFRPRKLILVNRGENALFQAERVLAAANDSRCQIEAYVLDVRSEAALQRLFVRHRPQVVLHAAAHKHVPMMERQPAEAVLNNVGGMRTVAEAAHGHGADSFVFISTDKAVHPASVMGATKRIGELQMRAMAQRGRTRFVSVRFGNVLGSNGSVLPIFIDQVQRGGPVTVTHPEMTRYFMSIPEACNLVLRAAARGRGGELIVLDMGKPMRIVDLAARVIERAGLRPGEDVPIIFSKPRPGEKLTEQLMFSGELPRATSVDGVWSIELDNPALDNFDELLDELLEVARSGDDLAVRRALKRLVPDFPGGEPAESTEEEESAAERVTQGRFSVAEG